MRLRAVPGQKRIGALADRDLALRAVGLALLVERHDHDRGTVSATLARKLEERALTFLEANRIDDRLARHTFEPCLDHAPFRTVDHHGDSRDVGFGADPL